MRIIMMMMYNNYLNIHQDHIQRHLLPRTLTLGVFISTAIHPSIHPSICHGREVSLQYTYSTLHYTNEGYGERRRRRRRRRKKKK